MAMSQKPAARVALRDRGPFDWMSAEEVPVAAVLAGAQAAAAVYGIAPGEAMSRRTRFATRPVTAVAGALYAMGWSGPTAEGRLGVAHCAASKAAANRNPHVEKAVAAARAALEAAGARPPMRARRAGPEMPPRAVMAAERRDDGTGGGWAAGSDDVGHVKRVRSAAQGLGYPVLRFGGR